MHVLYLYNRPNSLVDDDGHNGHGPWRMMLRRYGSLEHLSNNNILAQFKLIFITTWLLSIIITLHYFDDDASHHLFDGHLLMATTVTDAGSAAIRR